MLEFCIYLVISLLVSLIHSVARNPSLTKQLFGYAIFGFPLTEAIALFALMKKRFCFFFKSIPFELLLYILTFLLVTYYSMGVAWANSTNDPLVVSEWIENPTPTYVPWSPEPFFVPDIPVLEQPLINDALRRTQLYNRLGPHSFVNNFSIQTIVDLVYQQAEVEKSIEAALILDGISPIHLFAELNGLRGFLFYPHGSPVSGATLARYIREIARLGTRQSIPYRRVKRAILNYELFFYYYNFFRNNQ